MSPKKPSVKKQASRELYSVLGVSLDASREKIKKAYYRLALQFHPDRNPADSEAKARFQSVGQAYEILSDPQKRRLYDETGIIEGSGDETSSSSWAEYFREMFKKVTMEDLEAFRAQYVGSQEEHEDILAAYVKCRGDIAKIAEMVFFGDVDSEDRYLEIVKKAIARNIVPSYAGLEKIVTDEAAFRAQQRRRKRRATREAEEATELAKEMGLIDENGKRRDLTAVIQGRHQGRFDALISNLEARYASPPSPDASTQRKKKRIKVNK